METIITANSFDIFYATNNKHAEFGDMKPHLDTFRKYYCNTLDNAVSWLSQFGNVSKPELPEIVEVELSDEELKCPKCGFVLNNHMDEWCGDGTLDRFFNISS